MAESEPLAFDTPDALGAWLLEHHATAPELWVRMWKKATGKPSVTWNDCVLAALAVGWIDAQSRPDTDSSWLQRLVPRRPRSLWSARNVGLAERLIAEGRMHPAGLSQVERAKADGRWDAAYAGSKEMVIPADFLAALEARPTARATYDRLKRAELYAIYHRLTTAKTETTRTARMTKLLDGLDAGKGPHDT